MERIEGLKLLKDWSTGLVTIEGIAIGFIGTLLKSAPAANASWVAITSIVFFVLSIISASIILGVLPWLALPNTPDETARKIDKNRVYEAPTIVFGSTVGFWCGCEGWLFVLGIIFFAIFVVNQ